MINIYINIAIIGSVNYVLSKILCQVEGNYKNAWSSNVNHYIEKYKKENYIK